ncbi:hypothetical protein DPMN_017096 [Dreissena polymorpha]|uniref:Uncharacterized protein n=1 Tax=Dreissena polymorpha TaxID=45954 RepID=A0A9D4NEJ8_DREPO|nr:hypothetical protein DPMN_017096 [Dreissena polymorpha]
MFQGPDTLATACLAFAWPTQKPLNSSDPIHSSFCLVAIIVKILSSGRGFEPTTSRVVVRHFNHVAKELAQQQGCWK